MESALLASMILRNVVIGMHAVENTPQRVQGRVRRGQELLLASVACPQWIQPRNIRPKRDKAARLGF
jgi:hypothetical protein